jgi:preprotein translocase subunit SecA
MGLQKGQPIIHPWINTAIERAQKKVEAQHFEIRKNLLKFDNVMNDQRRVVYDQRREIMAASDVSETIHAMRDEVIENTVAPAVPENAYPEQWDITLLKNDIHRILGLHIPAEEWAKEEGVDQLQIAERIKQVIDEKLAAKETAVSGPIMRQIEKSILLQLLDQTWKEHLLNLDYLRQGIVLRAFGQKDPLNEYRTESFAMFEGMLASLREKVTNAICLIELHADRPPPSIPQPKAPQRTILSRGLPPPDASIRPYEAPDFDKGKPETWSGTPRNSACPCGSGKKYKYCHGKAAWG